MRINTLEFGSKMESNHSLSKQRLIIASNRLPLSVKVHEGIQETTSSSGGLVSALTRPWKRRLSVARLAGSGN